METSSDKGFRLQKRLEAEYAILATDPGLLEAAKGCERFMRGAIYHDAAAVQSIRKHLHACGVGAMQIVASPV